MVKAYIAIKSMMDTFLFAKQNLLQTFFGEKVCGKNATEALIVLQINCGEYLFMEKENFKLITMWLILGE